MAKPLKFVLIFILIALAVKFCGGHDKSAPVADSGQEPAESFDGLRILAGSELKDLDFLQAEMEQAAGSRIRWSYSGTLDMVDALNAAAPGADAPDLAWAASGKYLSLAAAGKVKASEKIMLSPVILGVKASAARQLGWDRADPTWGEVAAAVKAGRFHYGMSNPSASNSGFCAVVGVAAALSGKTDGLEAADIQTAQLREFFAGQKLTSGSSGWLADAYVKDPAALDGLINYESVILSLNAGGQLAEPLVAVYPKEGIITSDYPLMLVNEAQRAAYDKLVAFLRSEAVQARIMARTHRRPVLPAVKPAAEFGERLLIELPFPGTLDTLDALLTAYQDELRRPGHAYFVLDTSGSMSGERIDALREGLAVLAGGEGGQRFLRFALREKVDLIPFSSEVHPSLKLDFGTGSAYQGAQAQYRGFVGELRADGGTAIYEGLLAAYQQAAVDQQAEPQRYYSIVLMTDGQNTQGRDFQDFRQAWEQLGDIKSVRVFPILFGDSDVEEMRALAEMSGGKVFDGRKTALAKVFKEIRGYQ